MTCYVRRLRTWVALANTLKVRLSVNINTPESRRFDSRRRSSVVEHRTRNSEVVGSDPTGGMWLFFFCFSNQFIILLNMLSLKAN
uniref:Putative secreted protein n=1 Tax=Amblyomma cajennense TaxID=34607 RepID=A0A023FBE0_AMBCJ